MLNEVIISRAILDSYFKKLDNCLELDVAIVGGGPRVWWPDTIWPGPDARWRSSNASFR